ncbi:MAG: cation-transporting P-type ATPase [Thermodesulfobacteriota bacterium]
MRKWHAMEIDQVLRELNTDPHHGLSDEEVQTRLKQYGYNELRKKEKPNPRPTSFIHQFRSILALTLFIAAVVSVLVPLILGVSIPTYWVSWLRIFG